MTIDLSKSKAYYEEACRYAPGGSPDGKARRIKRAVPVRIRPAQGERFARAREAMRLVTALPSNAPRIRSWGALAVAPTTPPRASTHPPGVDPVESEMHEMYDGDDGCTTVRSLRR